MIEQERVSTQNAQLKEELESIGDDILHRFPIGDYLNDVTSHLGYGRLSHVIQKRKPKGIFPKMTSEYDLAVVSLYLKFALSCAISNSLELLKEKNLTGDIVRLYHEWFGNILDEFSTQPDDYYHHRCYSYVMDVRVCTLTDIPVGGAWLVEITRVGLHPLISGGPRQCIDYLQFVTVKTGGFTPFCVVHTVPRYLCRFNKEEMDSSYLRIAELMKLYPGVRGVYRRSWFLDPKLEDISPDLVYLRQVPQHNGAKVFNAGTKKRDVKYALAMSPVRKRLYAQGKYQPTGYAYVCPRKEFLAWAERKRGSASSYLVS